MRLFLSYAQPDQDLRDRLIQHLSLLKRERILDTWDISEITAGTEREPAIAQQIDQAEIILLLISAAFIASDRYEIEMQRAIERHEKRQARVIPILLKPCDWESAPFAELEVLPKGGKPVTAGDIETALSTIAQEIRRVAVELNPALAKPRKSVMKLGAPLPGVRLPENFVERPEALNAVKALLLEESEKPLVVSAIAGLGGLGKSVLATALVLDSEVQERFEDGILWVTLGQNPDLQSLLGDWIRTLDKSRESYSANTLEAASRYLQTLLIEKRMLLVVDDVWIGAHVEHFRVGGAACRMLVTTREAQIEGAEVHALDLMSEEEAIALVRQKLNRQWNPAQESEVKAFAKSLGYLPLALDLAANQVRDGLSWGELRSEFETERRAVALEVLDSSEAWETLDEKEQRKYSLRACFNLSLRRLSAEQLRQFAWLGVLPEDVSLDVRMAMTLWELPRVQAKKVLVLLKNRSFLTSGTETLEGEPTFRVHDLMHDTARGLLEQDALSDSLRSLQTPIQNLKSKIQNLASAHAQLLERYRLQAEGRWDRLPNDGYIHRHLTWHFVQAGMEDEIHALMAMSDERGRNAWFEACDRIGQTAIFVQDVKRGWEVAEQSYEEDSTKSIILQCKYSLLTATLHSLVGNFPAALMLAAVKSGYWTIEQAWSYVEQIQDDAGCSQAIAALAPHLSQSLVQSAIDRSYAIRNSYCQNDALSGLYSGLPEHLKSLPLIANLDIQVTSSYYVITKQTPLSLKAASKAILIAKEMSNRGSRENALYQISQQIPKELIGEALEVAALIQDEEHYAKAVLKIAQHVTDFFSEVLETLNVISDDSQFQVLLAIAQDYTGKLFPQVIGLVKSIQNAERRAQLFLEATKQGGNYTGEVVKAARLIKSKYGRAKILSNLAHVEARSFTQALNLAQAIDNDFNRVEILCTLAQADSADFSQLLKVVQNLHQDYHRLAVLRILAKANPAQLLQAAQAIVYRSRHYAEILQALEEVTSTNSANLWEAMSSKASRDEYYLAETLSASAREIPEALLPQVLDTIHTISHTPLRAKILSAYLSYLPLAIFSPTDWRSYLHLLAHRTRADLMQDLATLYPAIVHLGGKEAVRGMVDAMREVCQQWK